MTKSKDDKKCPQPAQSLRDCEKCEIVIQLRSEAEAYEERDSWRRLVIKRMRGLLWECKGDNRPPTDDEMTALCVFELEVGRNVH